MHLLPYPNALVALSQCMCHVGSKTPIQPPNQQCQSTQGNYLFHVTCGKKELHLHETKCSLHDTNDYVIVMTDKGVLGIPWNLQLST